MNLLGSPEVAALSWNPKTSTIYGVRIKASARGGYEVTDYAQSRHNEWQRAADAVLKELAVKNSTYMLLVMPLENSEVFECSLPAAKYELMRDALRFEVPRQLMSVPEEFRLQFVPLSSISENDMIKVRCAVFPESSLHKLSTQTAALRNRPDAVINPLLTLPDTLPEDAKIALDGCPDDFCWQSGSWQLPDDSCNQALDDILNKLCGGDLAKDFMSSYRTALCGAIFGSSKLFVRNNLLSAVTILPAFLRPSRFRTQLRVMALLIILLLGVNIFRYAGSFISDYNDYRKLRSAAANKRTQLQELRKKLKAGEKQLKELERTAELKLGSRECMGYLGYLSEKLPDDVLLNHFRWNEGVMDLNLQTTSPDLDLVSFFNRLAGFKVVSASQRTNPANNFTNANVKLSVKESSRLPVRSKSKKSTGSKAKR